MNVLKEILVENLYRDPLRNPLWKSLRIPVWKPCMESFRESSIEVLKDLEIFYGILYGNPSR